jgi:hypothetical protein
MKVEGGQLEKTGRGRGDKKRVMRVNTFKVRNMHE